MYLIKFFEKKKKVNNIKKIALIDYDISVIGGVQKVTEKLANMPIRLWPGPVSDILFRSNADASVPGFISINGTDETAAIE